MGYPLFASKQTFARIVFLPQGERLETKRALRMLNFLLKTRHEKKNNYAMLARMGNSTESTYTYYRQCERLQGIH